MQVTKRALPFAGTRLLAAIAVAAAMHVTTAATGAPRVAATEVATEPAAADSQSAETARPHRRYGHGTSRRAARSELAAEAAAKERANQNSVAIVSGNPNGTYLTIAYDMSAVLDDGDALRVLPILGKGGAQNVRDVLYLHGVDMGITQTAIVNQLRRSKELGDIDSKLVYVARLFNEEMHILARPEIRTVRDLAGKTVNFSDVGSGTQLNAREVFEALGVHVTEVNLGQNDAFEKMRSGEIAASVLVAGKPAGAYAKLKRDDGLHFLSLSYDKPFEESYFPAKLTSEDYPNLIARGEHVDTIAAAAVLVAYNWRKDSERYRKLAHFVDGFFGKLPEFLKKPRHPKWQEVNLGAVLPGWTRFEPAQNWLDASGPVAERSDDDHAQLKTSFDQFMSSRKAAAPGDSERMFEEFLRWRQQQAGK